MPRRETTQAPKQGGRWSADGVSMILLTGPSGSGKTTLAKRLAKAGWVHIDGDQLAKSLYKPGSRLMRSLVKEFGARILRPQGFLDAHALGEIVFSSPARMKTLNRLVHPRFLRALRSEIRRARVAGRALVADVPVYFALGAPDLGLPVVLVTAPLGLRLARLRAMGLSAPRASKRARSLRFGRAERKLADQVIDGSQSPARTWSDLRHFLTAA
jgi:dephospho-CoA kinase